MARRKIIRNVKILVSISSVIALIGWIYPPILILLGVYIALGMIDVSRNKPFNLFLLKRYFFGNGAFVFLLSPLNLIVDLLCFHNKKIYKIEDYPLEWQREIKEVLAICESNKQKIMSTVDQRMHRKNRGMLFYKWYGHNYNNEIVGFNKNFRYIKTIGVSVFKEHESTSGHFGPLRMSLRVLYNLKPSDSRKAYIETMGEKHYWQDSQFFSFDDTLYHLSMNQTNDVRYCVFIDVVRPCVIPKILGFCMVSLVGNCVRSIKGLFYPKWDLL